MNISNFEREKPKETYSKIRSLEKELESLLEFGKKDIDASYILDKIRDIKNLFLNGK
jgi:dimeric dUTPase (all-alpha-NTP-PPase superfamily)